MALIALRFINPANGGDYENLLDAVNGTDEFVDLLESSYRSHAALLNDILEPECDVHLLDTEAPIGDLYESFPKPVALYYERAVRRQMMTAADVKATVEWYTGNYKTLPSMYAPLAGHITLEGIREAIKRATVQLKWLSKPLTACPSK